jgi:peptidoglycan-N-acetylglucosamine deacetylase
MRRFWTTKPLQMVFPNVIWKTGSAGVHLTFDDGPDPAATPRVLELLAKNSLKATFFLLGANVEKHPEIARRAAEEGHLLGIHAYDHVRLAFRSRKMIQDQLERTRSAVQMATGHDVRLFRPPFGFLEPSLLKHIGQMGFSTVMWDVDPGDWLEKDPVLIAKRVEKSAKAGSIVLLHDNANTRDRIVPVLQNILGSLKDRSLAIAPLQL